MKKARLFICIPFLLLFLFGSIAFAADNLTDIEQKWLDFQRAVRNQEVKDGIISQKEADSFLSRLENKLSESGDAIYDRMNEKRNKKPELAADIYARLTNRSKEDVLKTCEEKKMTVLQLAKAEGKLEALKNAILLAKQDMLSQKVKDGKITQQEMDEKLKRIESRFSK